MFLWECGMFVFCYFFLVFFSFHIINSRIYLLIIAINKVFRFIFRLYQSIKMWLSGCSVYCSITLGFVDGGKWLPIVEGGLWSEDGVPDCLVYSTFGFVDGGVALICWIVMCSSYCKKVQIMISKINMTL